MVNILAQVVLTGRNLKLKSIEKDFYFDVIEDDYALINEGNTEDDYLKKMVDFVNKLYANYDLLKKSNVEKIGLKFVFSYKNQGNVEIHHSVLEKIVKMDCGLDISFYEDENLVE